MEMKGPLSQSPRIATVNNWYNSSIILHSILQFALFIQQATPSFHISICTVISIFSTPSKFSVLCTYLTLYNLPFLILMDIEVISTLLVYKYCCKEHFWAYMRDLFCEFIGGIALERWNCWL